MKGPREAAQKRGAIKIKEDIISYNGRNEK